MQFAHGIERVEWQFDLVDWLAQCRMPVCSPLNGRSPRTPFPPTHTA